MSTQLDYDIRADGRAWLDDEPVDASEYPVPVSSMGPDSRGRAAAEVVQHAHPEPNTRITKETNR